MKLFRVTQTSAAASKVVVSPRPVLDSTHMGKAVIITENDGRKWVGAVSNALMGSKQLTIVPGAFHDGAIMTDWTGSRDIDSSTVTFLSDMPVVTRKMAAWDAHAEIDIKRRLVADKDGVVQDYKDISINGYLSTFENYTLRDRDGDYVKKDAFNKTLKQFMENPVILVDHDQKVSSLAGSFSSAVVDANGLKIVGKISNAPGVMDIRFKIAEGHLKTLSMGGLFLYGSDGKAINEVDLWEGSLVAVPANSDARFCVRSLDTVASVKALKRTLLSTKGELRAK